MKINAMIDAVRIRALQESILATLNRKTERDDRQQLDAELIVALKLDPMIIDGTSQRRQAHPSRFLSELVHSTALECLAHAQEHRDVSLMMRLHRVCDESLVSSHALLAWFARFSPIMLNGYGNLKLRRRDDERYREFDLAGAKSCPLADAKWFTSLIFRRLTPAETERTIDSLRRVAKRIPGPVTYLAQLGPEEIKQLWLNAIRVQTTTLSSHRKDASRRLLDAIEEVWSVRTYGAPDGWFKWPTTYAPTGHGGLVSDLWLPEGPLKFLGYSVGEDSESPEVRRAILERVFEGSLPPVFPRGYLKEWGKPGSPARLKKMADSIASFARSRKRHDTVRFAKAIGDWESDLRFLHRTYYIGIFGFEWPTFA